MPATNNISRPYVAANPTSNKQGNFPVTAAHVGDDIKEENEFRPIHTDQYEYNHIRLRQQIKEYQTLQQTESYQDTQYEAYNHPYFAPYTHSRPEYYNQPYFGDQQPVPGPYRIPEHESYQRQQHVPHLQPQTLHYPPKGNLHYPHEENHVQYHYPPKENLPYPPKENHTPYQYPPKKNMIPYQTAGESRGRNEWDHEAARPGSQVIQANPSPAPPHSKVNIEDPQYQNPNPTASTDEAEVGEISMEPYGVSDSPAKTEDKSNDPEGT